MRGLYDVKAQNAKAEACATSTRGAGKGPIKASGPYSEQMRFMR
jgi:hypothetical protein